MKKQQGFGVVGVLIILVVVSVVGFAGYTFFKSQDEKSNDASTAAQQDSGASSEKVKNIGINLDYYDPETGMAGDIKFTKDAFASDVDLIFFEYGMQIAANSASAARRNPQPTFIVPLGTEVMSLVDGTVVNVPKLYSNDYSIHVQPEGSDLIFETEHVINVKVKKGDTVKAGQPIAEVSDYDAKNYAGLGLYEIGILKPGNPPSHVCVFDYLDDSVRDDISQKLTGLMKSWETFRNNPDLYDETTSATPGCQTRDPIEG